MDTKLLERFATKVRRDLLAAVDAQATAVLAIGSVARTERGDVVKKLEAEITAHGRAHMIDKVAYTWFNRIIALRFMDARSYTDAGVVSPAEGQTHGQPEILTDAKRGNLNTDVVINKKTAEAILGLLDGTRRSTNAEGEAYALLLTEYCRHWHRSMPFMFEREGDYTELLVPAGLLADGAILSQAREVLTEEVCGDVEVIGWLYQFYISERKDEVFAGFKNNNKAGADEIPAATQLFTPHWIVQYLVENSIGRMWMLNRPASRLVDRMKYYIAPVDENTDFLRIAGPEELTMIDPACGSGHMLTYAFDLLYAIYEEEGYAPSEIPSLILTHNLHGTEIDPRAGSLAAFALTMKARAKQRSFFNKLVAPKIHVIEPISFEPDELDFLIMRRGSHHAEKIFWNQFAEADILGSLIQPDAELTVRLADHLATLESSGDLFTADIIKRANLVILQAQYLSRMYGVVVANPPYMGSKNMNARLAAFAKENYPQAKADLMTMFMCKAHHLVLTNGWWAMINLPSWMSLSSFEEHRIRTLQENSLDTLVHFGRGVFGSDFGSVGFVFQKGAPAIGRRGVYRKLFENHVEVRSNNTLEALFRDRDYQQFIVEQSALGSLPGQIIAYWLSDAMRAAFTKGQPLGNVAEPRKGLDTGNNAIFLRMWWEVARTSLAPNGETGRKWLPYNKGGEFRRWYGNREVVVNWANDGALMKSRLNRSSAKPTMRNLQFMKRSGFSWGTVTSGGFSARFSPPGALFDNGGCTLFAGRQIDAFGALINSSTADAFLRVLAPTLNFQPGDVAAIPVVPGFIAATITSSSCVEIARQDWDTFETSWDFAGSPLLRGGQVALADCVGAYSAKSVAIAKDQQARETKNNRVVAQAYGLEGEVPVEVPLHRLSLTRNVEFRYGPGKSADAYATLEKADIAAELVSYALGCMFGRYSLDEPGLILADQGATLQDYLARIPSPTFRPDVDNVIPFVDDGWFEDDIVERFRLFLRSVFGVRHFEENLRFVEESLGVKKLRDYFITTAGKSKFYDDHVQRYKKRPIYWMFSSPKGSFNALIYMHRYNPSTVPTVLNEYLREYRAKLEVALSNAEQTAAAGSAKDQKEADRLRKVLAELRDYEHDVLYPLATQQLAIDLDDGVKANYPKFYPALKKIVGLEAAE